MPNPIELIRTSRLRVPVDADGVPLITTVAASGAVQKTVRSTELYQPVMDDGNGNKIPVFAVLNGGGDDGGDVTIPNQITKVYVPANAPTGSQVIVTLSQVIGSQTLVLYDAEPGNGVTGVTMTGTNPYTLSVTAALPEMWGVQLQ